MEWNGSLRNFVSMPDTSNNFPCNYNYDPFPVVDQIRHQVTVAEMQQGLAFPQVMEKMNGSIGNNLQEMKKKRLTSGQLDSLEKSFQEEIKLDPDRKMKLSKELGLQPRQIAVWFQNRRARWKAKQLEHLYDELKQEYDAVSQEKEKLQEEVVKLRAVLRERGERNQASNGYRDYHSGDETVESTSVAMCSSGRINRVDRNHCHIPDHLLTMDYNEEYWMPLPYQ